MGISSFVSLFHTVIRLLRELLHMHEERIVKRKAAQIESAVTLAKNQTERYLQEWVEGFNTKTSEQLSEKQNQLNSLIKDGEILCSNAISLIKRWNVEDAEDDALCRKIEGELRGCVSSVDKMSDDATTEMKSLESCLLKKKMQCLETFKNKAIKTGRQGLNGDAARKYKT